MRTVIIIVAAAIAGIVITVLLLSLLWPGGSVELGERYAAKESSPIPFWIYHGQELLEERIATADVIVRVRLSSHETVGAQPPAVVRNRGGGYYPAIKFTFEALEYLKGSGGSELAAYAFGIHHYFELASDTAKEAKERWGSWIGRFRDDRWDDREAIVFLNGPDPNGAYAIGRLGEYRDDVTVERRVTIADDESRVWLPDASVSGPEQYFLLGDPHVPVRTIGNVRIVRESATSKPATISLSTLKAKIAAVEEELAAYRGDPEAGRRCLITRYQSIGWARWMKATNDFGVVSTTEMSSGLPASTKVVEHYVLREGYREWYTGPDKDLFTPRQGVMHTNRPLPEGEYRVYYQSRKPVSDCGANIKELETLYEYVVRVAAPADTVAESFFDPYAEGAAVVGSTTVGTIRWKSGLIEARLTPDVTDSSLDFIALDGSVSLTLDVSDATEDSGTLSWPVVTQPLTAGDKLMLRVRGTGCSGGVAVADPPANPGLVKDCRTLMGAKYTLAGGATLNWTIDTAITGWDGVTVGGTPMRVTDLELNDRGLTGSIPPELGALTGLERLVLSFNEGLAGEIPVELGDLINLRTLNLGYNGLTGGIPRELGNLTEVITLWLQGNELTGEIPGELGNLSALEYLDLADNELTGPIPVELSDLTELRRLGLHENDLSGTIPGALGNLTGLRRLWMYENQLSGEIPGELGMLTALVVLELNDNQLIGSIPEELGDLTNLSTLRLSDNSLEGCILPALQRVRTNDLGQLDLPDCAE